MTPYELALGALGLVFVVSGAVLGAFAYWQVGAARRRLDDLEERWTPVDAEQLDNLQDEVWSRGGVLARVAALERVLDELRRRERDSLGEHLKRIDNLEASSRRVWSALGDWSNTDGRVRDRLEALRRRVAGLEKSSEETAASPEDAPQPGARRAGRSASVDAFLDDGWGGWRYEQIARPPGWTKEAEAAWRAGVLDGVSSGGKIPGNPSTPEKRESVH